MSDATPEELAAGRGYETLFVPSLFAQWPRHLIQAAGISPGQTVLDIACGTGALTRDIHGVVSPGGHVVGLDPAPGMLAVASERAPDIEWTRGSAEDLPFAAASFDRVVSQFGIMFFPDRAKATREISRVLRPDGHVAVAIWDRIENNPAYRVVVDILDAEIGTHAGDATRMPFNLGTGTEVADLLGQAGFTDIESRTIAGETGFPSARTMCEAELRGWLPLFGIHLDEGRIDEILAVAEAGLASYTRADGVLAAPLSAHVISGRKPTG